MSAATASVEVLTAEVRTLVIGKRQVTRSVYRQLDWVEPDDMEPFGRVSVMADDESRRIDMVGRCIKTGALVRSSVDAARQGPIFVAGSDDLSWCEVSARRNDRPRLVHILGHPVQVDAIDVRSNWNDDFTGWRFVSEDQRAHVVQQLQRQVEERRVAGEAHRHAAALPLIVLAGLR